MKHRSELKLWVAMGALMMRSIPASSDTNEAISFVAPSPEVDDVAYHTDVSGGASWEGARSGVEDPQQKVFRDSSEWNSFWEKNIAPYSRKFSHAPPIEFEKQMIVGVFQGVSSNPNSRIRIVETRLEKDKSTLLVKYVLQDRLNGIFTAPASTTAFYLRRVPLFTGDIRFEDLTTRKPRSQ